MAKYKPYRYPLYLLARFAAFILMLIPRRLALRTASVISKLEYRFVPRHREEIFKNLKFAYGDSKSKEELDSIGEKVVGNLLQSGIDFLRFSRFSHKRVSKFVDVGNAMPICKDILQEGKGLIIMTSHIGNWEFLAGIFAINGFPGAAVGRRIYYEPYNKWIVNLRLSVGVRTIYQNEAVRGIHRCLKNGEVVGLLPDQDLDRARGVFVDFFGKPAYTNIAPVKIAMKLGTPILIAFMIRQPKGRYKLFLGDVIRPKIENGNHEASIEKYTKIWMREFETMIRKYPEQWGWLHNRWRTRPEDVLRENKIEKENEK